MLYTLIGNGSANTKEVLASLESLRSAVAVTDEFWMTILDPPEEMSATMESIVAWVRSMGIYYEVVAQEGVEVSASLKDADEIHVARRPLDFIVKLTKGRVQPGEKYAILVLSTDLDQDQNSIYAIERAIADEIPVFDLGSQMVQVLLEEDTAQLVQEPEVAAVVPSPVMVPHVVATDPQTEQETEHDTPALLETPTADDFTLPNTNGNGEEHKPYTTPLVLTRSMLEDLSRDELKSLVRTHEVQDDVPDMREKEGMIKALLAKQDGPVEATPQQERAQEIAAGSAVFNEEPQKAQVIPPLPEPEFSPASKFYLLQVNPDGAAALTLIPPAAVEPVFTMLAVEHA